MDICKPFYGVFRHFSQDIFYKFKIRYNICLKELKITRKEPDCALTVGLSFCDIFSHSNKNSTSFYLRPNKNISKKYRLKPNFTRRKKLFPQKQKYISFKFLPTKRQNCFVLQKPETLNIDR